MASDIISQANDTLQAAGAALTYVWGQCTRFVSETLSWVPGGLGNAYQWLAGAQARGLPTGSTPAPGAVAVWGQGPGMPFGHVAVVQDLLPGGGIRVAEENWLGSGITDVRDVSGSALAGIQGFIYPPGGFHLPNPLQGAASTAQAISGLPASIGHGLANATGAAVHDVGAFARNQIVALVVGLVVALIIFGGREA